MHWYLILKAARKLDPLTSYALAGEVGTTVNIASAWLGKFCRWGYVVRVGSARGARRWVRVYELTRWGRRFKPKKG